MDCYDEYKEEQALIQLSEAIEYGETVTLYCSRCEEEIQIDIDDFDCICEWCGKDNRSPFDALADTLGWDN